jgi:hypothetical protein
MVVGYTSVGLVAVARDRDYDSLLPAMGALFLELIALWLAGPTVVDFMFNRASLLSLRTLPIDVKALTTLGLSVVVLFFVLNARFIVVATGIDLRAIFSRTGPRFIVILASAVPVVASVIASLAVESPISDIAREVIITLFAALASAITLAKQEMEHRRRRRKS